MKAEQLHQIIKNKNDQREHQIVRSAEDIIESIVKEQQAITSAQARIVKLRDELKALEVDQLDPSAVLGEA